jgi:hypothetical protein
LGFTFVHPIKNAKLPPFALAALRYFALEPLGCLVSGTRCVLRRGWIRTGDDGSVDLCLMNQHATVITSLVIQEWSVPYHAASHFSATAAALSRRRHRHRQHRNCRSCRLLKRAHRIGQLRAFDDRRCFACGVGN